MVTPGIVWTGGAMRSRYGGCAAGSSRRRRMPPRWLAWAACAGTCMRGPEGAPVQQCTGATRQSVGWRLADAGDVTSGQCLGPVPAMTCVAGNGRVRSSWESPRVPVPSRVHRRGEGWEWDDYPEILDDASSA